MKQVSCESPQAHFALVLVHVGQHVGAVDQRRNAAISDLAAAI
jgi:hypothetical protein